MTSEFPSVIEIDRSGPLDAEVRVPGSKSYTNRALMIAALADGSTCLSNVLHSDDTEYMIAALQDLGFTLTVDDTQVQVCGKGGRIPAAEADLFVGNSGTSLRFLTALVSLGNGRFRIDGVERMRQRPVQPLLDGLNQLGARARSQTGTGCPPVEVAASGLQGGTARMEGHLSSQYFSALLMAAPYARSDVMIEVIGELVSKPYIDMTLHIMRDFGAVVEHEHYRRFHVTAGVPYQAQTYIIEGDATAASYFFAAPLIAGGRVRVHGIDRRSTQGDIAFLDLLEQMGAEVQSGDGWVEVRGSRLHGIECDMNAISDTAQTLAVVAIFADSPTRVRNIAHVRHKETDRIRAVVTELRRCGIEARELPDGFEIHPGTPHPCTIETYDDHRMAMSFSLIGLRIPGIRIDNPGCVSKTFPDFFERLGSITRPPRRRSSGTELQER